MLTNQIDDINSKPVKTDDFLESIRNEMKRTTSDIHARIKGDDEIDSDNDDDSEESESPSVDESDYQSSQSQTIANGLTIATQSNNNVVKVTSDVVIAGTNKSIEELIPQLNVLRVQCNNANVGLTPASDSAEYKKMSTKNFKEFQLLKEKINRRIDEVIPKIIASTKCKPHGSFVCPRQRVDSLSESDAVSSSDANSKVQQSEELTLSDTGDDQNDESSSSKNVSTEKHIPNNNLVRDGKAISRRRQRNNSRQKQHSCSESLNGSLEPNGNKIRHATPERVKTVADLTKETKLIITLLGLEGSQRDLYLTKLAKEHHIYINKKNSNDCEINPSYKDVFESLKTQTIPVLPQYYERSTDKHPNKDVKSVKQHKFEDNSADTYESKVSKLINEIKERDSVPLSSLNPDLILHKENDVNNFVEKLLMMNIGYLVTGEIRINPKNSYEAFVVDSKNENNKDIYIPGTILRKCALHGDIVRVFAKYNQQQQSASSSDDLGNDTTKRNNYGFVVNIEEKKHTRQCIGVFMKDSKTDAKRRYLKFEPRDIKIPRLRIFKQNLPNALIEQQKNNESISSVLYLAEILDWTNNEKPIGSIIKSIGKCDELETENLSILIQNNLDISPYSEEIINQLPRVPFDIPEEELLKREDIRNQCVFTIDPLTARDLDDAMSLRDLPNGNYEIGVHISDVSYFLTENSELDNIVKKKATTIYMVDNVYHMLPKQLCFLCSLLPGDDKMAFSVFWEITPEGKVESTRFARTIINSCAQFAYEHAQMIIENPTCTDWSESDFPPIYNNYTVAQLASIVLKLQKIAIHLRSKRMANGALKIDQPKVSFRLDAVTGKPVEYSIYELKDSNRLIEDFMLLANQSVAEFIYKTYPKISILRNHNPPTPRAVDNLVLQMKKLGYNFDVSDSKSFGESMQAVLKDNRSNTNGATAVLNILCAKPMKRARYFCSDIESSPEAFYHYALALPIYTHFTSPIRRYADVLVHRLLAAALNYAPVPERTPEELQELATICNVQKYSAKLAGDECSELYFHYYIESVGKITTSAGVLAINTNNIDVVLIVTGHVIRIPFTDFSEEISVKVIENEQQTPSQVILVFKNSNANSLTLQLFSEIKVDVVSNKKRKIKISKIYPPEIQANPAKAQNNELTSN